MKNQKLPADALILPNLYCLQEWCGVEPDVSSHVSDSLDDIGIDYDKFSQPFIPLYSNNWVDLGNNPEQLFENAKKAINEASAAFLKKYPPTESNVQNFCPKPNLKGNITKNDVENTFTAITNGLLNEKQNNNIDAEIHANCMGVLFIESIAWGLNHIAEVYKLANTVIWELDRHHYGNNEQSHSLFSEIATPVPSTDGRKLFEYKMVKKFR